MKYTYQTCPCGELRGIEFSYYRLFKGIRYAFAERWHAPKEVLQWNGIFDATVQGPWCYQYNSFITEKNASGQFYFDETVEKQVVVYSEDCLNLNIWTPTDAQNAPVLFFIHGGSYETGGGSAYIYKGEEYCKRGVVLVTINYRLNAFASAVGNGFCGNYGLQDQICALNWIRHNITSFGGDPERITLMGESSGAMSVQNLIFSPIAKGLFCRAIMMSGAGILPRAFKIKSTSSCEQLWKRIQNNTGLSLNELQKAPAKELFLEWRKASLSNELFSFPAAPVIDGCFIPESPRKLVQDKTINAVPVIVGFLSEDMWPLDLYDAVTEWATLMEEAGFPPVYGFYFNRAIPGSDYGAFHGADLRYAFHSFNLSWRPFDETDERISVNMIDYFTAFVQNGVLDNTSLPKWIPMTQDQLSFMSFGDTPCEMCTVPREHLIHVQMMNKPFPGI